MELNKPVQRVSSMADRNLSDWICLHFGSWRRTIRELMEREHDNIPLILSQLMDEERIRRRRRRRRRSLLIFCSQRMNLVQQNKELIMYELHQ